MRLHNVRMRIHHGALLISGALSVPRSFPRSCVPAFTVAHLDSLGRMGVSFHFTYLVQLHN